MLSIPRGSDVGGFQARVYAGLASPEASVLGSQVAILSLCPHVGVLLCVSVS